eukprot:CAMPEP_0116870482 /NCGR_PEP_ID=MMETSP0463-20121206/397_1 /TAXON_ID=181622 /ORGANISM="Strombidinopsis sp, Strain SopsisLIS2011" /LENGTH=48 /DNA_ID= /DNA_START= /DNA_END= /DNA_ORIENTATION=
MKDPVIFCETIAENLRYAKPDATDEQIYKACEKAQALPFILSNIEDLT